MSEQGREALAAALKLPPVERAELVESILGSFGFSDRQDIDQQWAVEVEDRIDAHERGEIPARLAAEVFAR